MGRALVISPIMETRLPLQQLMERAQIFSAVETIQNLDEARTTLVTNQPFTHIFLSSTFSMPDVAKFIDWAKRRKPDQMLAFVLLLRPGQADSGNVANNMVMGIHGFLFEPFTLESIENVVNLSRTVSQKDSHMRMRAATGLMLTDMFPTEKAHPDDPPENLWQRVNSTCERVKHLTGQSVTMTVVQGLKKLSSAERVPQYDGASKRVRGLLERKIRETFGALYGRSDSGKK